MLAQPLVGTEGGSNPFWSPDSRFVGFIAQGKLKKIDVTGGPPLTIADAPFGAPGTWNRDDVIVFNAKNAAGLFKVSATGGTPVEVTKVDKSAGDVGHSLPYFLPDGRHFVYEAGNNNQARSAYVGSIDANEKDVLLLPAGSNVKYAQGYLLFMRQNTLMAQAFDADRLQPRGEAVPVAEQVEISGPTLPFGAYTVSETGVLVLQTALGTGGSHLVWSDRTGQRLGEVGEPGNIGDIELSPDGKRALVSLPDQARGTRDLWIVDFERNLRTRFTFDGDAGAAVWTPDGSRVIFAKRKDGLSVYDLFQKPSNGAGTDEPLLADSVNKQPQSISPDGKYLLYQIGGMNSATMSPDVWGIPLSGDRRPFPFLQTRFIEAGPRFSPDGRWVAYQSNESGRLEVYIVPFPGPGGKWQASSAGGGNPRWRRDGKELFYAAQADKLMVVSVNGQGASFEVGPVRPLFEMPRQTAQRSSYDVSGDGQRFLVNAFVEQGGAAPPLTLVVNWTAGLRK